MTNDLALYAATQLALKQANADAEQIYRNIQKDEEDHRKVHDTCMAGYRACLTYVYSGGKMTCQR